MTQKECYSQQEDRQEGRSGVGGLHETTKESTMKKRSFFDSRTFPSPEDLDDAMRSCGEECLIEKQKTEQALLEALRLRMAGVSLDVP